MEDDFKRKDNDDFGRNEKNKKNMCSDAHFYSYMKKLNTPACSVSGVMCKIEYVIQSENNCTG